MLCAMYLLVGLPPLALLPQINLIFNLQFNEIRLGRLVRPVAHLPMDGGGLSARSPRLG